MNILSLLVTKVLAQGVPPPNVIPLNPGNVPDPGTAGLAGIAGDVINILFGVAGGITLIVIIILGYEMFTSKGKEEQFKKALTGISYAALGLTILGLAYAIVEAIIYMDFF